jgi:hypothetical protein
MAERSDRARRQGNSERDEIVREGRDGEARDPDLVSGLGRQEAAARRGACPGRGVLVRRRVPHRHQVWPLGTYTFSSLHFRTLPFHALKRVSQAYPVSKVLLEKAASRFAEEHGVSLVTVCPLITVGAAPAPSARTSVPNCLSLLSGEAEIAIEGRPYRQLLRLLFMARASASFSAFLLFRLCSWDCASNPWITCQSYVTLKTLLYVREKNAGT